MDARLRALESQVATLQAALAHRSRRPTIENQAETEHDDAPKPLSRRRLLGAGTAVAAGGAGLLLGTPAPHAGDVRTSSIPAAAAAAANATHATTWFDVRLFGGLGDGVLDNTAALNGAATWCAACGGGTILLPTGHYAFSGVVTIPSGVDVRGTGGHRQGAGWFGSVLEATTTNSQLVLEGTGGESGNFVVDGRDIAANPNGKGLVHMDLTVERSIDALWVVRSGSAGVVIDRSQNCTFTAMVISHCAGDGLVLDLGAGGNAFLRNQFNASGGNGVVIRQSGASPEVYPSPQHNYFLHCLVERGPYPDGDVNALLNVTRGHSNTFNHCIFALGLPHRSRSGALVVVNGAAVNFEQCKFSHDEGVGIRNDGAGVFFYNSNWFAVPTAVEWNGTAYGNVVGTLEYGTPVTARWAGTGAYTNLASVSSRQLLANIEPNATYGLRVARAGERGYRFNVGSNGEIALSDGTTYSPRASWRLQTGGSGWETSHDVLLNGGALGLQELGTAPANPPIGRAVVYVKDDKLVVAFNDAGTMRYRWMMLSGATTTWSQQDTTAP